MIMMIAATFGCGVAELQNPAHTMVTVALAASAEVYCHFPPAFDAQVGA